MAIFKIFFRLLVLQFYKLNAAFFLFMFLFFFGIISPGMQIPYHLSIIHSEINSYFVLGFVIGCWLVYNLKCVSFFKTIVYKYRSSFLHELQTINEKKLLLLVMVSHGIIFLPVTAYAFVVTCIAFQQNKFVVAIVIILSIVSITLISSNHIKKLLLNLTSDSKSLWAENLFGRRFIIVFLFYPIYYILYKKKAGFFALKIFSFLLFYLVFIRLANNFDKDSFINILILIGYFHSILTFQINKFLEEKCSLIRNLPLTILQRIMVFFIPVCIIYLPEILYLYINGTPLLSASEITVIYLFLVSQLMLFTSIIYISNFQLKIFLRWIFAIAFLCIFLNKLMPLNLLIAIQFLFSYMVFKFCYFKYEHIIYS